MDMDSGPHCLRHYKEARQEGDGVLTVHLPREWAKLKEWAKLVEEGGVGPL